MALVDNQDKYENTILQTTTHGSTLLTVPMDSLQNSNEFRLLKIENRTIGSKVSKYLLGNQEKTAQTGRNMTKQIF